MSDDYKIRIAGVRVLLGEEAWAEDQTFVVERKLILDHAEADPDARCMGGYCDLWIQRDSRADGAAGMSEAKSRLAGVRVHAASGHTYQALMPSGHPRSPLRMSSGADAVAEAVEIMEAHNVSVPVPVRRTARGGRTAVAGAS